MLPSMHVRIVGSPSPAPISFVSDNSSRKKVQHFAPGRAMHPSPSISNRWKEEAIKVRGGNVSLATTGANFNFTKLHATFIL